MSLIKAQKELVVNVLQQEDGKEDETVQIRIQSGDLTNEVEGDEGQTEDPQEEVEEDHAALMEMDGTSYDERISESDENAVAPVTSAARAQSNRSRYHKYKQRWSNSWLEKPEFQGWLTRNEQTRNAYCILCKRDVKGSRSMLERHSKTGKHIDNVTNFGSLVYKQSIGTKGQPTNIRYMIEPSDGTNGNTGEQQVLLVSQVDTGQQAAVYVNQEEGTVEGEPFNGVMEDGITSVDMGEIYTTIGVTEQFSASHRLHSPELTAFKNQEIFGKCNNPNGHGHNYKFTVDLTGPRDKVTGMVMNIAELKALIQSNVLRLVDHKNLDLDVPYFKDAVSTVENIAIFIWRQLRPVIDEKHHIRITVNETDKNRAIFPALI